MTGTSGVWGAVSPHRFRVRYNAQWFHPADGLNVAYGFCATCGSSLR